MTRGLRNALEQAALQIVAQRGDADGVLGEGCGGEFRGFAKTDDACNVFRAGAEAALMVSAEEEMAQRRAAADIEGADPFGAVNFVSGEGQQVNLQSVYVDRYFAGGLDGVGMEIDVGLARDACRFLRVAARCQVHCWRA